MNTIRVVLKTPFLKLPAGVVFELSDETTVTGWDDDERVRERQNFSGKQAYLVPDDGRGLPAELLVSNTKICPDHIFEGIDLRTGEPRITRVETGHGKSLPTDNPKPPCGILKSENVSLEYQEALKRWGVVIQLPPFEAVAEKMVLIDTLRNEQVIEYELRNYKLTDTRLDWDLSDLRPGFYQLQVRFPGDWFHSIRLIKFFPLLVDAEKIPPAPEKPWQKVIDKVMQVFESPVQDKDDLRNQALDFCLEWGEMFNKPTQERMMAKYPSLTQPEADELDRLAREVRSFVYDLCQQEYEGKMMESDLHFEARRKYPWLNNPNLNRMINVGMYYARR